MKSVLITFDQAHYVRIIELLDKLSCRGFSYFEQMRGRGSKTGEPHYGSHAWPSMCSAIITVVEDSKVAAVGKTASDGRGYSPAWATGLCLEYRASNLTGLCPNITHPPRGCIEYFGAASGCIRP